MTTYIYFAYIKEPTVNNLTFFKFDEKMDNQRSLFLNGNFDEVFNQFKISPAFSIYNADIIFFQNLTHIEKSMIKLFKKKIKYPTFVYGFKGLDLIAGKNNLYEHMSPYHPEIFPLTFILPKDFKDYSRYQNAHNKSLFILKSNCQRQQGTKITNNINYVKYNIQNFVVCQKLIQNPFLVNGHKINTRLYLLVCANENDVKFYLYLNGFLYYTPKKFQKKSPQIEHNITSGYIDRKIYIENPLTLEDFSNYIGEQKYKHFFNNASSTIKKVCDVYRKRIFIENKNIYPKIKFTILGCDVAPDSHLKTKLMEINKGPDLNFKDENDKKVKHNMLKDAMNIALYGIISKNFHEL